MNKEKTTALEKRPILLRITPESLDKICRKMAARRQAIMDKYGISNKEMRRVYPLITGVNTFYKVCCLLIESPEYFLYENNTPSIMLPDTREEYEAIAKSALNYFRMEYSEADLGERLRENRKNNHLTLKQASTQLQKHMKDFPVTAKSITTYQAIGAHERGIKKNISIFMLMGYCNLYGINSLDMLVIGEPFIEMIHKAKYNPMEELAATIVRNDKKEKIQPANRYKSQLLAITKGKCELCEQEAPFKDNGIPYLEIYHITPRKGSTRNTRETVLLCPNCKARIRVLHEEKDLDKLLKKAQDHEKGDLP